MNHNLRNVVAVAVVFSAATAFTAHRASGQARTTIPCPIPMSINQTAQAPSPATPFAADFPPPPPPGTGIEPKFGGNKINMWFEHTFTWKPPTDCCQLVKGALCLEYKALQGGPAGSSTSANDAVTIMKNGVSVSGPSQPLYKGAVKTGQAGKLCIDLTPAMLAGNRLSFLLQDDSSVTRATLQFSACCVRPDLK
jgi:hypothetical protein